MATEKEIIVALELATTAIRAIAGQRMPDGTMQVLSIAQENASNCVRKGIVDNIDKTTQAISRVVGQISLNIGQTVKRVYVGLGGQSLHSVLNVVPRSFAERTQVTAEMIDQLMDTNRGVVYADSQILEVVPQEYQLGVRSVPDPVGYQVEQMEARFLNVIARSSVAENIERCIQGAGLEMVELIIAPLALADTMLSAAEKRSGSALVDIGADTTTVSIYTNNLLRHLVVLPLGGQNVTNDIASIKVESEEAESLKLRYAHAWQEDKDSGSGSKVSLSYDRTYDENALNVIIESRYEEILCNIWNQLEEENDRLTSGVVFTGGAAQVRNLVEGFTHYSKCDKSVHVAKGLPGDISLAPGVHVADNGRLNTLMALLLHGDQNCVSPVEAETQEEPVAEDEAPAVPQSELEGTKEEVAPVVEEDDTPDIEVREVPRKTPAYKKLFEKIKIALQEDE